jgi:hypothetical protein
VGDAVEIPPLERVILKGLNLESGFVMVEAMAQEGKCLFGMSRTEGSGTYSSLISLSDVRAPATSCTEGPNE